MADSATEGSEGGGDEGSPSEGGDIDDVGVGGLPTIESVNAITAGQP